MKWQKQNKKTHNITTSQSKKHRNIPLWGTPRAPGNSSSTLLMAFTVAQKRTRKFYSIRDQHKSQKLHAHTVPMEQKNTQCIYIWNQFGEARRDTTWKQHGETLCVMTVTKHKALVLISKCKENQNCRKRSLMNSLMKRFLAFPNKDKLMADLFPNIDDKEYQGIAQDAKDIDKEQGKLEAHEILLIADTVQPKLCYDYATPGHRLHMCTYTSWSK